VGDVPDIIELLPDRGWVGCTANYTSALQTLGVSLSIL
jgi:hypothetical protein